MRKWKSGTEKLMMQRHVKARYHSMMAPEAPQRLDELTALAVAGRLRSSLLSHVQFFFSLTQEIRLWMALSRELRLVTHCIHWMV